MPIFFHQQQRRRGAVHRRQSTTVEGAIRSGGQAESLPSLSAATPYCHQFYIYDYKFFLGFPRRRSL